MDIRFAVVASIVVVSISGCARQEGAPESDDAWVGSITSEGDVTTVVNESGSVWGGAATLVEEASIGAAAGAEEYMFGAIHTIHATDDHLYVVDPQGPAVRVYDHDGTFVRNLGAEGQGPGEYVSRELLAADQEGRVFVLDYRLGRINVSSATGEPVDTWPIPNFRCCAWRMYPLTSEAVWAPVRLSITDNGVQAVGPEGPYGDVARVPEIEYERST